MSSTQSTKTPIGSPAGSGGSGGIGGSVGSGGSGGAGPVHVVAKSAPIWACSVVPPEVTSQTRNVPFGMSVTANAPPSGSKTVGGPRPSGGGLRWLSSPSGIVTGAVFSLSYENRAS